MMVSQIDRTLLEILACPACHSPVRQEGEWLVCDQCKVKYPIRDGLPIMLVEEAEPIEADESAAGEDTEETG